MNWRAVVFNGAMIAFLGLFAYGAVIGWDLGRLGEVLVAAFISGFVGNLDRIESFKATPGSIEARTHAVISEAKDTIAELRQLAKATGEVLVRVLAGEGRYGAACRLQ